jgi:hypothetical protein
MTTGKALMNTSQSPEVLAFRIERLRKGPRNWTYWIAAFTALNGVFLLLTQDFVILAGLVFPFAAPGTWSHFLAAAVLVGIGHFGHKIRPLLLVGLSVYLLDTIFAGYLQLWSGVVMHVVVLILIALALSVATALAKRQASNAQPAIPADRA